MSAFQVLAEPHRRHILDLLREGERSVNELVAGLGLSQPGVSKHLRVLRDAGLVGVRVDAQRRLYALQPQALAEVDRWLQPYRALWSERLDAIGRQATTRRPRPPRRIPRARPGGGAANRRDRRAAPQARPLVRRARRPGRRGRR
jgi:DNA-binding transcriptional ArsR family regulator